MKNTLLSFAAIAILACSCQTNSGTAGLVNPNRFAAISDSLQNEQIVDVRTPDEYASGHLTNAMNINWNSESFFQEAGKLDKSKPLMVYCLSGGRSAEAVAWFKKNGFTTVYELQNGIMGWKQANLPVTQEGQVAPPSVSVISPAQYKVLVNSKSIVLADFSATWCGPCKRLAPRLDELEKEMGERFLLVRLDADRDAQAADSLSITALPTLMLYKNGILIWRNEGLLDKEAIADQIKIAETK